MWTFQDRIYLLQCWGEQTLFAEVAGHPAHEHKCDHNSDKYGAANARGFQPHLQDAITTVGTFDGRGSTKVEASEQG
jgi:hypothetical protein